MLQAARRLMDPPGGHDEDGCESFDWGAEGWQRRGAAVQSFSSVVGPNGSGKSNVIDSMLFVFGKRAKQLRLNKVRAAS